MYAIRRLVPFGLLALATAVAQDPAAPDAPQIPPSVPVQPAAPGGPQGPRPSFPGGRQGPAAAAAQQVNQDNIPLPERKKTEPIINPKLNGNELAGLYREYTGRRVVVSSQAALAEFSFVQDASPKDPLTYAKISELLKMAALIEGFVFVPSGEGVDKLLFAGAALANPKGAGIRVFNETDELPVDDEVITYVMTLRYLKPDQAAQVFTQIVGQLGSYGSIAPIANASAVIITENTSLIRKLIQLREEIDKASSEVSTRFIKVQYADVTELAETLNELLGAQQQAQRTAGIQRTDNVPIQVPGSIPGAGVAGQGGNRSSGGEDTPVQIVPDPRTNRIFAMGRPVDLVFVEGLVREFDTKTDEKNFLRRKLRFLSAADFLPIAGDALNRAFSNNGQGGGGGGAGASGANFGQGGGNRTGGNTGGTSGRTNTSASNRGSTSSGSRTGATGGSSFGGGGGTGGGGTGGTSSSGAGLSESNVSTAPVSVLVGRTLLVADNITNSIIVQGPPASVEVIERLLEQVDVRADQVMISTVFGQLTLNDKLNYGVSYLSTFSRNDARDDGGIAGSSNATGALVNPSSLLTPTTIPGTAASGLTAFPATGGLALYGKIGSNFNVYLNALQSTGNFTVLSRPSIYTANNKMGMISSGQQIAVPTGTYNNTGINSGGLQTNIEYKDVVLKLEVIPLINSEHEITLQISLVSDEVGEPQTVGELTVPTIITREMTTTVTVPNNETVVLGGLIITRERNGKSGIPILSKIPGLGALFSTTTKDKEKSELLIFMQPSIVRNSANLDAVQADMGRRYKLEPDMRNFADGPGGPILPPDGITPVNEKYSKPVPQVVDQPEAAPVKKKKVKLGRPS